MTTVNLREMSDLHIEHMHDYGSALFANLKPLTPDEILVLPGDIFSCAPRFQALTTATVDALCGKWGDIVYVPGNHEFYGTDRDTVKLYLIELSRAYSSFHVLSREGGPLVLAGRRFIGDTMWVPWHDKNILFQRYVSDFRQIANCDKWIYDDNKAFREYLTKNLQKDDIVITHHLPSPGSVAAKYVGDQTNRFFLSEMSDLIAAKEPAVWLHGHTHDQFDYKQGATRIVANPKGYPNEPTSVNWDPNKVVVVS